MKEGTCVRGCRYFKHDNRHGTQRRGLCSAEHHVQQKYGEGHLASHHEAVSGRACPYTGGPFSAQMADEKRQRLGRDYLQQPLPWSAIAKGLI